MQQTENGHLRLAKGVMMSVVGVCVSGVNIGVTSAVAVSNDLSQFVHLPKCKDVGTTELNGTLKYRPHITMANR